MDHLLANSDNPVPAAGEADSSASGAAGKDDEDEDEALRMHIKKTGASDEPVVNVSFVCIHRLRAEVLGARGRSEKGSSSTLPGSTRGSGHRRAAVL